MTLIRIAMLAAATALAVPACATTSTETAAARNGAGDEGWTAFGHALDLAQIFIGIAAHSQNPDQDVDQALAGRRADVNRAASGLLDEATADMPPEYRARVAAIAQDMAVLARKSAREQAQAASGATAGAQDALQARKDLSAMGLRYYDPNDFLAAVKRDDALAVQLFIAGRGVDLNARDADGHSALDIARRNGNTTLAAELARNLPQER